MYAEEGLFLPYFQSFSQEAQQIRGFYCSQRPNASMTSSISEYDLGEEGDLFKAPEPIVEEALMDLDPMTASISLISCADDVISPHNVEVVSDIENGQILSEVFYECKKDMLVKDGIEAALSQVLEAPEEHLDSQGSLQKTASAESLNTMVDASMPRQSIFSLAGKDFDAVYGMKRSLSEGDIKSLGNGSINLVHSPLRLPQTTICSSISEERKEKLSRYRIKKAKRNFGRKIKYACRKALADSQPRIRGRFARTEEVDDAPKKH